MNDDRPYFVTNDHRIIDATPHPDDLKAMPPNAIPVTPERAYEIAETQRAEREGVRREDLEIPDAVVLTRQQLHELARKGDATRATYCDFARRIMDRHLAETIRRLRVDHRLTWRGVAARAALMFPTYAHVWSPPSNQLMGVALCQVAAESLGEDYFAEPWN